MDKREKLARLRAAGPIALRGESRYAGVCREALAGGNARSGDRVAIAADLGRSDAFGLTGVPLCARCSTLPPCATSSQSGPNAGDIRVGCKHKSGRLGGEADTAGDGAKRPARRRDRNRRNPAAFGECFDDLALLERTTPHLDHAGRWRLVIPSPRSRSSACRPRGRLSWRSSRRTWCPTRPLMCDVGPAVRPFGQLVVFRRRAEPRGWPQGLRGPGAIQATERVPGMPSRPSV